MHLTWLATRGWTVASETVEPGHMRGGQACCLASICLPLGFAAGRTPNITIVSLERESESDPGWPASAADGHVHNSIRLDDFQAICNLCGTVWEVPLP